MLRALSQRLVDAQRPIRILEAVRWDASIEESFFAKAGRELPAVTQTTYAARSLAFDPRVKRQELRDLARDVRRCLGTSNPVGKILFRMCEEYRQVIDMLVLRGSPGFTAVSKSLYGSSRDSLHAGGPEPGGYGADGGQPSAPGCRFPSRPLSRVKNSPRIRLRPSYRGAWEHSLVSQRLCVFRCRATSSRMRLPAVII